MPGPSPQLTYIIFCLELSRVSFQGCLISTSNNRGINYQGFTDVINGGWGALLRHHLQCNLINQHQYISLWCLDDCEGQHNTTQHLLILCVTLFMQLLDSNKPLHHLRYWWGHGVPLLHHVIELRHLAGLNTNTFTIITAQPRHKIKIYIKKTKKTIKNPNAINLI